MKRLDELTGKQLRRHRRLLRRVQRADWAVYVCHEHEFRLAERLHRAGLIACAPSRPNWDHGQRSRIGKRRSYRELACFRSVAEALQRFPRVMEGHGSWR
jgi:hypothetical protein